MATLVTDIPQLKFNKMSKEKYEELLANGELVENEFYITPENEEDISDKADITYVDEQIALKADKETTYTKEEVNSLIQNVEVDAYTKEEVDNLLENIDALPEQTDNSGKLLSTDGENALWIDAPSSLPTMDETTSGKFLTNNNGNAEWIDDPDINTNGWNIFDHKFSDHLLNDPSWVRSDTYSWQDGGIYFTAYEELEKENSGRIDIQEVIYYQYGSTGHGQIVDNIPCFKSKAPAVGDRMYYYNYDPQDTVTLSEYTVSAYDETTQIVTVISDDGLTTAEYLATENTVTMSEPGNLSTDTYEDITITYYKSANGLKICLPDQSDAIEQLYDNTGVAWYYIIDTENKRFKLPRSKWNFVGSRGNVGDYVDETLPNIKGSWAGVYNSEGLSGAVSGTFKQDGSKPKTAGVDESLQLSSLFEIDASRSSSTYQDNAPVQQRATEMYLYFFMGDTLRDARIIDINAVVENQTNVTNELDALKNLLATIDYVVESKVATDEDPTWYRVYKSGWVEQGGCFTPTEDGNTEITITYPKPFKDTSYTLLGSINNSGTDTIIWDGHQGSSWKTKTTTSFTRLVYQTEYNWEAKGQGAQ